jgi:hypothetical protein
MVSGDLTGDERTGKHLGVDLIDEQLQRERDRNASLEQRGVSVITTTGTLVTLLFALSGLTRSSGPPVSSNDLPYLTIALVFLVIGAVGGMLVNFPRALPRKVSPKYKDYADSVDALLDASNEDRNTYASLVDDMQIKQLKYTVKINSLKGRILGVALSSEAIGIIFLAWTVHRVLD